MTAGLARASQADHAAELEVVVVAKARASDGVVVVAVEGTMAPLPAWSPGAHIDVVLDGDRTRQYSLCGDPADTTRWRIGVLREAQGRGGSVHIHDRLQVGDTVTVRGPRNHFHLAPAHRYLFVAGGIGVTPLLPMLRAAEAAGADWRLVYGGRTRSSMAFTGELAGYGDRVTLVPTDECGLLDLGALFGSPEPDTLVYCCGPEPLLAAVESACAHWPADALHVERFAARPLAEPAGGAAFDIVLQGSGRTLTVAPEQSVLAVLEQAGIPVFTSCEEGPAAAARPRCWRGWWTTGTRCCPPPSATRTTA